MELSADTADVKLDSLARSVVFGQWSRKWPQSLEVTWQTRSKRALRPQRRLPKSYAMGVQVRHRRQLQDLRYRKRESAPSSRIGVRDLAIAHPDTAGGRPECQPLASPWSISVSE